MFPLMLACQNIASYEILSLKKQSFQTDCLEPRTFSKHSYLKSLLFNQQSLKISLQAKTDF